MLELSVNVDDMTAEQIGFAMDRLFEAGAVEVFTIPIGMKKNRPGTLIRSICSPEKRDPVIKALFRHTSTIGIREIETRRSVLTRRTEQKQTSFGMIRVKYSEGYGVTRKKAEYEDVACIARENGLSLSETMKVIEKEL